MARARNLKPSFFKNEDLADLGPWAQLCFAGLWTLADREGRMEDRPRRIKAELFPYYDDQNNDQDVGQNDQTSDQCKLVIDQVLISLDKAGFITRYEIDQKKYIQINNFEKHQNPHVKEQASTIPAPDKHHTCRADSLNPITPSPIYGQPEKTVDQFSDFWDVYPKKVGKKPARDKWKAKKLDRIADEIIKDVEVRSKQDGQWIDGFIPNPLTYLNQERWQDEIIKPKPKKGNGTRPVYQWSDQEIIAKATELGISTSGRTRQELVSRIEARI